MKINDTVLPENDPAGLLSEMAADLRYEDIPEEHLEYAKKDILDEISCMIAGSTGPTVQTVLEQVREWDCSGNSRIVVFGDHVPPTFAAYVNGTIARACDMGDTHNTGGHICEWIVPTLITGLGMTDKKISGKEFLTAFIAGAEWGAREHVTVHLQYHTTVCPGECAGPRYATAALAKMLGLNKDQIWAAQGMAYGARPMSEQQKYNEGTPMVRVQHGYVCSDAVKAVGLAAKGVEGVKGIYMGEGGLLKNIKHGDLESPDFLTADLGKRWIWREGVTMKPYAGCKYNHTPIYGLLNMMAEHNFGYQDIESVNYTVSVGCKCTIEPADLKWNPKTPAEAMFSNPYSVAYAAITGDCFLDAYEPGTIEKQMASEEFRELMGRLHYTVDTTLPPFDDYLIVVTLKNGKTYSKVERELMGNTVNPMTWEQIGHKLWNCTRYAAVDLGKDKYEKLIEYCKNMEQKEDLHELLDLLTL